MQETEVNTTRRWGTGRKKVEMKKIESKSSLIVTFCQRRNGHFKKAKSSERNIISCSEDTHGKNNMDCDNINEEGEGCWWERSVEDLDFEDLEKFKASLETLKNNVAMRVQEERRTRVSIRDFFNKRNQIFVRVY
ncbi:hypothetical protein Peur_053768 [Populus x canadensis]